MAESFTGAAPAASEIAAIADHADVVVMEAYHSHFHPLRHRLHEMLDSGELGTNRSAIAVAAAPIPPGRDFRWDLALGGGGLLDIGYGRLDARLTHTTPAREVPV